MNIVEIASVRHEMAKYNLGNRASLKIIFYYIAVCIIKMHDLIVNMNILIIYIQKMMKRKKRRGKKSLYLNKSFAFSVLDLQILIDPNFYYGPNGKNVMNEL